MSFQVQLVCGQRDQHRGTTRLALQLNGSDMQSGNRAASEEQHEQQQSHSQPNILSG